MNTIGPLFSQVLAVQEGALNFRIQMALEAKRQDIAQLKGDAVTELLRATDRSVRQTGKGRLFDRIG